MLDSIRSDVETFVRMQWVGMALFAIFAIVLTFLSSSALMVLIAVIFLAVLLALIGLKSGYKYMWDRGGIMIIIEMELKRLWTVKKIRTELAS